MSHDPAHDDARRLAREQSTLPPLALPRLALGDAGPEHASGSEGAPRLPVSETFLSVQGEGSLTGIPSFFIRLSGCNLRCTWCDTPYASWQPEGRLIAIADIVRQAVAGGARHAVITGGEPMIFPHVVDLTRQLQHAGMHVTIETAGTVHQPVACDLISISPKLSSSTPAHDDPRDPSGRWHARHEARRLNVAVLQQLIDEHAARQLKFVACRPRDLDEIQALLGQLRTVAPEEVMLMPEGVSRRDPADLQWVVRACIERNWRYCHRVHIELFGNTRGT